MKLIFTALDAAISPFDIIIWAAVQYAWIFALAALLVAAAIVGIVIFTKKKNKKTDNTNQGDLK